MKNLLKRNQVIITALAIMIAVAGYLNFTSDKPILDTSVETMESEGAGGNTDDDTVSAAVEDTIDGAKLAQEDAMDTTEDEAELAEDVALDDSDMAEVSVDEDGEPLDPETVGETVLTSAPISLSQAKLNREQTRSKEKEILLEIINNEGLEEDSKQEAISEMLNMTKKMEQENAAETGLSAKGFPDSIVSISEGCVDVTVGVSSLTDTQRTQIEDVVTRKTGCELTQVVITTANQ